MVVNQLTSRGSLIDLLRSTLRHLEQSEDLDPDDPALIEIKNHILRAIAELDVLHFRSAA